MRHAPDSFVEKLEREFRGRLRIRWSNQDSAWHIEQKVARGLFPGTKPTKAGWDETFDKYIRQRDGYAYLMTVTVGDWIPCYRCKKDLKVPYYETEQVKCGYCYSIGRDTFVPAVHFPLGDGLLGYLKSIDPENPLSEGQSERVDAQNAWVEALREQEATDKAYGQITDGDYRRMTDRPFVMLGGATKMWQRNKTK